MNELDGFHIKIFFKNFYVKPIQFIHLQKKQNDIDGETVNQPVNKIFIINYLSTTF